MSTFSIAAFLTQLIAIAKDDTLKIALPIIATFISNVAENTSGVNIVAQLGALQAELAAALPNDEQAIVKDVSTILQAEVTALEAEETAKTTA